MRVRLYDANRASTHINDKKALLADYWLKTLRATRGQGCCSCSWSTLFSVQICKFSMELPQECGYPGFFGNVTPTVIIQSVAFHVLHMLSKDFAPESQILMNAYWCGNRLGLMFGRRDQFIRSVVLETIAVALRNIMNGRKSLSASFLRVFVDTNAWNYVKLSSLEWAAQCLSCCIVSRIIWGN